MFSSMRHDLQEITQASEHPKRYQGTSGAECYQGIGRSAHFGGMQGVVFFHETHAEPLLSGIDGLEHFSCIGVEQDKRAAVRVPFAGHPFSKSHDRVVLTGWNIIDQLAVQKHRRHCFQDRSPRLDRLIRWFDPRRRHHGQSRIENGGDGGHKGAIKNHGHAGEHKQENPCCEDDPDGGVRPNEMSRRHPPGQGQS